MKSSNSNVPTLKITPMEAKSLAAGSEKGQQIIPGVVGVIWAITLM